MLHTTSIMLLRIMDAGAFSLSRKNLLLGCLVAMLPGFAGAVPAQDIETGQQRPARQVVEQRIEDQPTRILEQMKSAVCGTGPFYAGTVDAPIFVTPLLKTDCTITQTPRDPR
jgi:hypothetical protein